MQRLKDSSEIREAARLIEDLLSGAEAPAPPAAGSDAVSYDAGSASPFRGDRIEETLETMCRRGGFSAAVAADGAGLPLAAYNVPVKIEAAAAFTSILGEALGRAADMLNEENANHITMDINYTDKAVIRRFLIGGAPYFLMVICPQEAEERSELELSIEQITSILSGE